MAQPHIERDPTSWRILKWNAAGAITLIGTWLLLVPWDLSEVDAQDQLRSQGGSNAWPWLVVTVSVVAIVGCVLAYRARGQALSFLVGASCPSVVLFGWRFGVARTRGANLWIAGLIVIWLPTLLFAFGGAYLIGRLLTRLRGVSH